MAGGPRMFGKNGGTSDRRTRIRKAIDRHGWTLRGNGAFRFAPTLRRAGKAPPPLPDIPPTVPSRIPAPFPPTKWA